MTIDEAERILAAGCDYITRKSGIVRSESLKASTLQYKQTIRVKSFMCLV
jgi:hypothetical protein